MPFFRSARNSDLAVKMSEYVCASSRTLQVCREHSHPHTAASALSAQHMPVLRVIMGDTASVMPRPPMLRAAANAWRRSGATPAADADASAWRMYRQQMISCCCATLRALLQALPLPQLQLHRAQRESRGDGSSRLLLNGYQDRTRLDENRFRPCTCFQLSQRDYGCNSHQLR